MTKPRKRINARLPNEVAEKLEELLRLSDKNLSQIIVEAIEQYYLGATQQKSSAAEVLSSHGFIGCGKSKTSLSKEYKQELKKILDDKAQ